MREASSRRTVTDTNSYAFSFNNQPFTPTRGKTEAVLYIMISRQSIYNKLNTLCHIQSPSIFEENIKSVFHSLLLTRAEKIITDCMGNVIAGRNISNLRPIVLTAHIDEIGFIVNHIDAFGKIFVKRIGGIRIRSLECLRVDIHHGGTIVKGIFCTKKDEAGSNIAVEDISELWVDIGCSNFEDTASMVQIGDYATFEANDLLVMGIDKDLLSGKSLDNRVGMFIISEVFNVVDCHVPLYACGTTQEEIGCRGAIIMANNIKPKLCIVVDVTPSTDIPGINKAKFGEISVGRGVVIPIGANVNNNIQQSLISLAKRKGVKFQIEALAQSSGTDAKSIQTTGTGINTVLLSIPCRYMHSPNEMVSMNDIQDAIYLLSEFIEQLGTPLDQ